MASVSAASVSTASVSSASSSVAPVSTVSSTASFAAAACRLLATRARREAVRRHAGAATPATGRPLRLFAAPLALQLLLRHAGHHDRDVAGPLADAGGAATGAGAEAPQRRALVGEAGGDVELVAALAVVVLGVGHGRRQHLADDGAHLPVGEAQHVLGPLHVQPADEVEDLAGLGGRAAQVLGGGAGADALAGDGPALVGLGPGHDDAFRSRPLGPSFAALIAVPSRSSPGRRGTGRCGWGRTRPACARPSTR